VNCDSKHHDHCKHPQNIYVSEYKHLTRNFNWLNGQQPCNTEIYTVWSTQITSSGFSRWNLYMKWSKANKCISSLVLKYSRNTSLIIHHSQHWMQMVVTFWNVMQLCKASCGHSLKSAMRFLCISLNNFLNKHTHTLYSIWDRSNGDTPLRRWTLHMQTSFQHRNVTEITAMEVHNYHRKQWSATQSSQSNVCPTNIQIVCKCYGWGREFILLRFHAWNKSSFSTDSKILLHYRYICHVSILQPQWNEHVIATGQTTIMQQFVQTSQ